MPARTQKKNAAKKADRPAPKQLTLKGKTFTLNMTPGTEYRLAQAGYCFPGSFTEPATAVLAMFELIRICSGVELTGEQIADSIESTEPYFEAFDQLLATLEANALEQQSTKGSAAGNG